MKRIIIFCFLFFCKYSFGDSNFVIQKIHTDNIYYNVIIHENNAYVSSNNGIFFIDTLSGKLVMHDESVKGAINPDLLKKLGFKIEFIESPIPLPDPYMLTVTDFAYHHNSLYIVTKGDLLEYENKPYKFFPYGSVRSISKNSIGTYSGVYINGEKLKKTNYTDGQVREFDSITFVCYNGIIVVKDKTEKVLYDNSNSKFSSAEYGAISDIFSIGNSYYLALSSKGIYKYDYNLNSFNLIYSNKKRIIPIRNKINNRIQSDKEFHFIDDDKYLSVDINTLKTRVIYDNINFKIDDILECSIDGTIFYGIDGNKSLFKFERFKNELKLISTHKMSLSAHTISDVGDLVFLSGNDGLSVFVKSIGQMYNGIINDEFNKDAVFKLKNYISFGSIHGVYSIENVNEYQKSSYLQNLSSNSDSHFIYEILIILFILISFLIIFKSLINKNLSNEELVVEIKKFIIKNLRTVTLTTLQDKFTLDYNAINNLQKGFSPAKFIKQERNSKAKDMFLKEESISKISNYTGYSESYLLKNKYNFLK
jgi:hypothetical protein|tara:strand:+ start:1091 stop:2698 length:1608 start_codon:yes stop_codon:yes gene_type:complete